MEQFRVDAAEVRNVDGAHAQVFASQMSAPVNLAWQRRASACAVLVES